LLGLMRDEFAIVAAPEPEGNLPAKIPAPGLLIGLHLPDTLADSVALCLGECGQLGWSLISATDGRSRRKAAVQDRDSERRMWAGKRALPLGAVSALSGSSVFP